MGQYWFSALYLGRLLTREAHARLLAAVPSIAGDGWLTDLGDPRGRYVLHPPGCYICLGSMDPILTEAEVASGRVEWSELTRVLGDEKLFPISQLSKEAAEMLQQYVRAASIDGAGELFGKYVVQGEWSSLDLPGGAHARVTHNIRCTNGPSERTNKCTGNNTIS
jgi:hypothetical protein